MAERQERCDLCRWWLHTEGHALALGDCRRYPPVKTDIHDYGVWAETMDIDWCGEFRPRDPRGFPA